MVLIKKVCICKLIDCNCQKLRTVRRGGSGQWRWIGTRGPSRERHRDKMFLLAWAQFSHFLDNFSHFLRYLLKPLETLHLPFQLCYSPIPPPPPPPPPPYTWLFKNDDAWYGRNRERHIYKPCSLDWPLARLYRAPLFLHLLLLLHLRTLSYLRMMTLDMEGIEDDTYINLVP